MKNPSNLEECFSYFKQKLSAIDITVFMSNDIDNLCKFHHNLVDGLEIISGYGVITH